MSIIPQAFILTRMKRLKFQSHVLASCLEAEDITLHNNFSDSVRVNNTKPMYLSIYLLNYIHLSIFFCTVTEAALVQKNKKQKSYCFLLYFHLCLYIYLAISLYSLMHSCSPAYMHVLTI